MAMNGKAVNQTDDAVWARYRRRRRVPWLFGILFLIGPVLIVLSPLRTRPLGEILFIAVGFCSGVGWFITMAWVLFFHCPRCGHVFGYEIGRRKTCRMCGLRVGERFTRAPQ
jgi:predicted RNA-binding Zn-ribbon protein involved in translation (DUF1610 family)